MRKLVAAFIANKREPSDEHMEALFAVMDEINADEIIVPLLEMSFEAIDNCALMTGQTCEELVATLRRVPALV